MLSCAITGHQPQRFKFKYNEEAPLCQVVKAALEDQIKALCHGAVRRFYVGVAVGVDTWAAEIIIALKRCGEFSGIELFCAIPFPEQADTFTDRQKKRYKKILSHCDDIIIINNHYSPVAYKRCDYFMTDQSQYLIAVYDQDKSVRSTTVQTVNYALKKELRIIFIHPDTADVSTFSG